MLDAMAATRRLTHLLQLRALQSLKLHRVFTRQLTAEEVAPFTPLSLLLPALRRLDIRWGVNL